MKVFELYDMFYNMDLDTWVILVRTKTDREVTLASRPYRYLSDIEKAQTVLDFGIKRDTEEVYIHIQ